MYLVKTVKCFGTSSLKCMFSCSVYVCSVKNFAIKYIFLDKHAELENLKMIPRAIARSASSQR